MGHHTNKHHADRTPDARRFIQIDTHPSIGIESHTGQAWIGVDQQVGHGSADALFALRQDQYLEQLADGVFNTGPFAMDFWRGEHDDLRLFDPRGRSMMPEHWSYARQRVLPTYLRGELWRHIDALGQRADSQRVELSRALSMQSASIESEDGLVAGMTFSLIGEGAYPRPAALIGGIGPGSTREQVQQLLGPPIDLTGDAHAVESVQLRLSYTADGLTKIAITLPTLAPTPAGALGVLIRAVGEPEAGPAFQAVAELVTGGYRDWVSGSDTKARMLEFEHGLKVQVEDCEVQSVRMLLRDDSGAHRCSELGELCPGLSPNATRAQVHEILGAPWVTVGNTELRSYGPCELLIEYGDGSQNEDLPGNTPQEERTVAITAVLRGTFVWSRFRPWRSGDFARLLEMLGRPTTHPVVSAMSSREDIRVKQQRGLVHEVTYGSPRTGFAGFIDGIPQHPNRSDIPLSKPHYSSNHDDLWDLTRGWVHMHASNGHQISSIRVTTDRPHKRA